MKNLIFLSIAFLFFACSKEETTPEQPKFDWNGTWITYSPDTGRITFYESDSTMISDGDGVLTKTRYTMVADSVYPQSVVKWYMVVPGAGWKVLGFARKDSPGQFSICNSRNFDKQVEYFYKLK